MAVEEPVLALAKLSAYLHAGKVTSIQAQPRLSTRLRLHDCCNTEYRQRARRCWDGNRMMRFSNVQTCALRVRSNEVWRAARAESCAW